MKLYKDKNIWLIETEFNIYNFETLMKRLKEIEHLISNINKYKGTYIYDEFKELKVICENYDKEQELIKIEEEIDRQIEDKKEVISENE